MRNLFVFVFYSIVTSFWCNAQEVTQRVRGLVMDAISHETLPGANVILTESGFGTITDMDGCFVFDNVPVGRYNLQVSFVGYQPVVIPELVVSSAKEAVVEISMEASFSEIEEIVVKSVIRKDKANNNMAAVSARTFSVEEARRYAGSLDDPGRMAGNFAGVNTAAVHVNAIVVRGNAPKGLLWRLEGVDIPVPSHFSGANVAGGGGITMFSGQLLANSDFYTGAFSAEYGNATAGVFDMKLRNGNNSNYEYAVQLGIQGIDIAAEGPLKKGGNSSFLFNYRYSTMALIFKYLSETKDGNEVPMYHDLSFKLNMPTKNAGTFSLWGIGGMSESVSEGFDDISEWEYPENKQKMEFDYNMGVVGLTHKKSLSDKGYLNTSLAVNAGQHIYDEKVRLDISNPTIASPKHFVDNLEGRVTLSSTIDWKLSPRTSIRAGFNADDYFYTLKGDARDFDTGTYARFLDGSGSVMMVAGHLQAKYYLTNNLALIAGFNSTCFEMDDKTYFAPRASAVWDINPKHSLSFGYGNHYQKEPLFAYFVKNNDGTGHKYPNKNLGLMGAHHFVLGYGWSPNEKFHIKIEPYYQKLYDVPVVKGSMYSMLNFLSDWTFNEALVNEGSGKNMGVDITVERFLNKGFYYMATASIYDSKYKGGDDVERRTRYDGGYILNLLGGKEWKVKKKNLLGVNLKLTLMAPYWYQPVDEVASHKHKMIFYDESKPFTDRHSNLETATDLTLTYRINKKKTSSTFAIQVKNLVGKQYQGKKYNLETNTIEDSFFTSPLPFISYKLEF